MSKESAHEIILSGCRPEPLAAYLKALGVLRLVAEQEDAQARGFWWGERFVLQSRLDHEALQAFFRERWYPTPIVAPWNGGSGFWPSTSDEALRRIEQSQDPRLAKYAEAIACARAVIRELELTEAPEKGPLKTALLSTLRARASDEALTWIDAAAVLTDEEPMYPALLGTGGNDGRQDFSNNFMQRVLAILKSAEGLSASLFGTPSRLHTNGSMGQFLPHKSDNRERSNPFDFVLAIEGSLVLAGAATRRLESGDPATLAFPFHARTSAAQSLADGEEGHGELWLPCWDKPATFRAVRKVFAEGRAKSRGHNAATGLDFARSVACLGTDRGLSEFVRYAFQPRNGKNYFALPIGRWRPSDVRAARLLDDLDAWYERLRQRSQGKGSPSRVAVARRRLEQAMLEATEGRSLGAVLLALGEVEKALGRSLSFATEAQLAPCPKLQAAWIDYVLDGTVEQRLAAALAVRSNMRQRLTPLHAYGQSFGRADEPTFVFSERALVDNLHTLLMREEIEAQQEECAASRDAPIARCSLTDIVHFIEGNVDDTLIERWLRGLVLVDGELGSGAPPDTLLPNATFAALALVHHRRVGDAVLPRTAGLLARACAGDASGATIGAVRRLSTIGRSLPVASLVEPVARMRRIAAALAFPLSWEQRAILERLVLPPSAAKIARTTTNEEIA
jgi:CRISPR-associated protein Csx17